MKHLRILLASLAIIIGGGIMYAQKDVTSTYITNATLSSLDGWTNVNFNTPVRGNNTTGYATECYEGWAVVEKSEYSLTQKITLPKGNYTLVNYSFFRHGQNADTDASRSLAFLKAGDKEVAVKTLGSISASGYANTQAEGANAFDSKMYRNTLDFTIDADDTEIEIGVYGTFDTSITKSWMILGMFELIDLDQEATVDAPFDVTGYIVNPGFEYRNMAGWTLSPDDAFGAQSNTSFDNKAGGYYAEKWQGEGALSDRSMSQTITDIPNGLYALSVYSYYGGTGAYLKANDDKVDITASTSGKYTVTTEVTDGTIKIEAGLSGGTSNWVCFDRFELSYKGDPTVAIKALWEEALAAAKEAIGNEDYENVTGEEHTALQAEIDKAEPTTADGYTEATAALNNATQVFTNAKAAYDAFAEAKANTTVPELAYASEEKKETLTNAIAADATSAADAATKTAAITTALRAYYESNALAEGVEGAVNMTDKITNPKDPENTTGWTFTSGGFRIMSGEPYTDADGTASHKYFDSNSWGTAFSTKFSQDVTLEAGKYILTTKARGNGTTTYQIIANEESTDMNNSGNSGGVFGRGWNDYTVEFEVGEEESGATIGINVATGSSGNWVSFGDFRLVQLSKTEVELAEEADYQALNEAIAAVEGNTLGFDKDEYAPYNNIEALNALAVAKAIDQNVENSKKIVNAATTALTAATWTANTEEVNAVYDGTLANATIQATSENVLLAGWTTVSGNTRQTFKGTGEDGKACLADAIDQVGLFVHPGTYRYGETTGYTMPLKGGKTYRAEAKYCAWANGSNNDFTLTIKNGDDVVETKSYGANGKAATVEGALKQVYLYFTPETDGDYVLDVVANGNTFMTDFIIKLAVAEEVTIDEAEETYTPEEKLANVTFKRTLVEGWNGLVLPFDMTVEDAKKVFNASAVKDFTGVTYEEGKGATLVFDDAEEIKAGKPFMVKTAAGTEYKIENVVIKTDALQTISFNDATNAAKYTMTGTYAKVDLTEVNFVLLQGTKYYQHNTGKASSAKAFRAYFVNESSDEAAKYGLNFDFDGEATGITLVEDGQNMLNGKTYNLQGQQVNAAQKGVYIVNGKKVILK